jgi:hypothetical protein
LRDVRCGAWLHRVPGWGRSAGRTGRVFAAGGWPVGDRRRVLVGREGKNTRTERIFQQGKALVRAIEALESIEPTSPIERTMAALLLQAYRRRLRKIVASAPTWVSEEILSASKAIDDQRPAIRLSDNWTANRDAGHGRCSSPRGRL